MSLLFYHLFRWCYPLLLWIASPFHAKAGAWVSGRRGILKKIETLKGLGPFVWVHCASLGEFEQGRPVMEAIRIRYPHLKILLTFFSPSGYEHQKNFAGADHVFYLPMDGPRNARRFIEAIEPKLVIFVKYEFWFYYLKKLHYRKIPLLLISAFFRPEMSFFHWYGALPRKMLTRFNRIFVQDTESHQLLRKIGLNDLAEVSGDTRFDRVLSVAASARSMPAIESFIGSSRVIIAGSSWPTDEQLWSTQQDWLKANEVKLMIVPHEIDPAHIEALLKKFPKALRFSLLTGNQHTDAAVLIVDQVGLLSQLYRYGWVNYVGGGFQSSGVHNVLEAAVYGRPVITGPRIEKYREARELFDRRGLHVLHASEPDRELNSILNKWNQDANAVREVGHEASSYVLQESGAVERILTFIQENRLLTN